MSKKKSIYLTIVVYIIVVLLDLYAVNVNNKTLEFIVKPLLMPVLAVVYLLSVKKVNFWMLSALFFSFWGDVMLLFDQKYFVFGLGSFLIAHLQYIKLVSTCLKNKVPFVTYLKSVAPFMFLFLGLLYLIFDNLNEMLVPVLFYGLVISGFGMIALVNYQCNKTRASFMLLSGAILFIISDSFIALNSFHLPNHLYTIAIMFLYTLSQYLICKGFISLQNSSDVL